MNAHNDDADCTLFCGNISDKVTNDILYELFLQAGPLDSVRIPKDNNTGTQKNFAFVTFKHSESVPYTVELMNGLHLYGRPLKLNFKSGSIHEQNRQSNFNRSMSAPNMRQYNDNMTNLGASPPFSGMPSMVRNQTYGPGMHNLNQQLMPLMVQGQHGQSNTRDLDNRGKYDRNMDDRQRDSSDRGRQRERDNDRGRFNRDSGRNSDFERSRSRGGDDHESSRRDYEDHGRQRSNDRDQRDQHDRRDQRDHRDRYRQESGQDNRNNSRRSGFDTPPQPSRHTRFDSSPGGGFPVMNIAPQRDINDVRQSSMASTQQLKMFHQNTQQMRHNQGERDRHGGNPRGRQW